jgi:hypothetical protein
MNTAARRLAAFKAHIPSLSLTTTTNTTTRPQHRLYTAATATAMATKTDKPVVLYTQGTPNGIPISVYLEELKDKYGAPDYE